ncbi:MULTISPECIES: hypothetical protein [Enterococcus]|uniref:hypothetical protein n=1 Tax=Enterococcus TaxID=1350 RepID=UPI000CF1BDA6|nr:hypothetical protein [Enterococcus faecium]EGP4846552.1 hypothetical protein [Enterococcus faecium]EGP5343963.1 hypothetical protein [Enterococcus faecium]EGP5672451.1 hypothetical protein [Enterococcus faecium]EGP5699059.1 hypothetical protein [Enterococcus faecium]EME3574584.1 hypothetical protein [Enterococcus faecium]
MEYPSNNNQNQSSVDKKNRLDIKISGFDNYRPAIQLALFVLWRIHQKQYQIGSRIFYEELKHALDGNNRSYSLTAYKEALAFLEGAGAAVNEVIIIEKVPSTLIQRYKIGHE